MDILHFIQDAWIVSVWAMMNNAAMDIQQYVCVKMCFHVSQVDS